MKSGNGTKAATICYYTTGQGLDHDCEILQKILVQDGWSIDIRRLTQRQFPAWFYEYRGILWDRLIPQWVKYLCLHLFKVIGRFLKQPTTDILIFLERVHFPSLLLAKQCVLIPNQEWFPLRERYALKSMDAILCKTAHALSIFSRENASSYFIGFESRDRKKNELEQNYSAYLHVAGKSRQKGTETLLRVWQRHPEWPQLTVLYRRE